MNIIPLPKGSYISQIEPFKTAGLSTNAIYHKTEAGCGFTRFALEFFDHNLICLEPNVPVIIDKVKQHNKRHPETKILGVYKGIDIDDIREYLLSDVKYKKIITTPEGFMYKVLEAFDDKEAMRQQYFILYDECERIISDVNYRGDIAAPLDEFFSFRNKALVSATTLPFSDERFTAFTRYTIQPQYDYRKSITLINTNNVIAALKKKLDAIQSNHVCVFVNSTKAISTITNQFGIADQSRTFCAQDSVVTLMSNGYKRATSYFDINEMATYNFFTSRYYSAFDIELSYKPDVVIVSDIFFAEHSIVDPSTEVIQIAGRFRNGINSLTHITNFNPQLDAKTEEQAKYYLKGSLETYERFVHDYDRATNPGSRNTLKSAIEKSDEHKYYSNGNLNSFMVDNFLQQERVKGYYQHIDKLKEAYEVQHKHFKVTFEDDLYSVTDEDFLTLDKRKSKKEINKHVAGIFDKWTGEPGMYVFPPLELFNKLIHKHNDLYKAFTLIGIKGLEECNYVWSRIKKKIKKTKAYNQLVALAPDVYYYFDSEGTYKECYTATCFEMIYKQHGINKAAKAADINRYFEARRTTFDGSKAYALGEPKFDIPGKPDILE